MKNAWLLNEEVPSNKTGRLIYLFNAQIQSIAVSSESVGTFELEIWEHDKTNFNLLYTLSVVADTGASVDLTATPINLTTGFEMAAKINNSGTAKNPVAFANVSGDIQP